ncbi:unnamed protein product [Echinostoma caproni]|uniref:Apt1 domain-containing protein n=1 Tax=Echinostoma caproni TaxID=27848 RepID=A0A183AQ59_9TREM|nr:unnamed protein product [Echinostoma caproni]
MTGTSSNVSGLRCQRSPNKAEAPPAAIVRRSEVCFEHAKWRMTESDGQIGLADVELRGFVYAKTHREDDSGSHWLELGWIRVSNLVPDCFQRVCHLLSTTIWLLPVQELLSRTKG